MKKPEAKVSKTTQNFAAKRGLDVETFEDQVFIYVGDNDCEPDLAYKVGRSGVLAFSFNLGLPQEVKEELPAHIMDEKHLREVLAFIAKEVA